MVLVLVAAEATGAWAALKVQKGMAKQLVVELAQEVAKRLEGVLLVREEEVEV